MKLFFDTSVLVAAMVAGHPRHGVALPWVQYARAKASFYLAGHTLAELYAVLTKLPVSPRISPDTARLMIQKNIIGQGKCVVLTPEEYLAVVMRMADLGITGGAVYDGLIAAAARKTAADRLLTFNGRDFLRVWPEGHGIVTEPDSAKPDSLPPG